MMLVPKLTVAKRLTQRLQNKLPILSRLSRRHSVSADYDVLIIGAGLSGIGMACYLQRSHLHKRFVLLEKRDDLGGTWDIFNYPGVRSDSDILTLSYVFRPWFNDSTLAKGQDIKQYISDTAKQYDIQRHIRYGCEVQQLAWSSERRLWLVTTKNLKTGEVSQVSAQFVVGATGYYDVDNGYQPDFVGQETFSGQIVHPQRWQDIAYHGKNVVVIGSGATAMTLVPALVDPEAIQCAQHVTMLQRSPTYVASIKAEDGMLDLLSGRYSPLSRQQAYELVRWRNVWLQQGIYQFATHAPSLVKRILLHKVKQDLKGSDVSIRHFSPQYAPWDQRLCAVPDADLFQALQRGDASVVTGEIERFTSDGILLKSGQHLPADMIVTATGLKLQMLGGAKVYVDGQQVDIGNSLTYKAVMIGDVPNMAILFGYTNASWTLKIDMACQYILRLLTYMQRRRYVVVTPKTQINGERVLTQPETVMANISAGYIQRAQAELPKQGDRHPWQVRNSYLKDRRMFLKEQIKDKWLSFSRK
ncbi:flavin-containing monooxygenase [Psychrobacter sp. I-STPA6b]|uniref:flavin-containing monooxygenase n=1 Tax=Psychrobacter sp. I-STPA6b TaxID=2585718 RepID=UPI001D0C6EEB|nr:NAD(P)/FAD-dependent oxidoreductase [Psychrobacter sp. I-STPA6b]